MALRVTLIFIEDVPGVVKDFGVKLADAPTGRPLAARVTELAPLICDTPTVVVPVDCRAIVSDAGVRFMAKSGDGA
mgnify:FL=1